MTLNRRAFLSVSALTLTTSACGVIMGGTIDAKPAKREGPLNDAEFEALVKNAKSEGSVTLYCVAGEETMRAWVRGFQEQYGIQVAIYRATVSDIYRRFKEESTSGRHLADAVSMSVPAYIQDSVDQGWAVQYRTRAHDELDPTLITADAGYPMYAVITAIAWNETAVDTALQERLAQGDYTALGEPELKDRVGIVGPTAGGTQLGTHLAIVDDAHLGWEYLEKLRSSGAAVFESAVPFVANDLSAGEYAAGIGVPDSVAIPRIYEGAPIRIGYPDPAPASMHQFFVSANAPHAAAGRLLLEWGTTREAQTLLAEITGGLVAHRLWRDQRPIRAKSWYRPPANGIDVAWQQNLNLDDSDTFIQEWLDRIG